jgi:hypothetical protein
LIYWFTFSLDRFTIRLFCTLLVLFQVHSVRIINLKKFLGRICGVPSRHYPRMN